MLTKLKDVLVGIVLLPFFVVIFSVFIVVWLILTLTGLGPLLQYCYCLRDKITLDREHFAAENANIKVLSIPGDVNSSSLGDPYKVFAIFSHPSCPSKYPPVCIPNGLGATAVLISQMQEALVDCGFTVLSFDRLGVGMSDENKSRKSPTAIDLVREMDYVMRYFMPADTKWILLGPSMGSIVAQCYISQHPDKVVGFLNMDGLPYPFVTQKHMFEWAGFIYRVYASIVWTGVLRPFIGTALKGVEKMFRCKSFPLAVVVAQMNQAQFYANVGLEMGTMMDCCAMAEVAWGAYSLTRMDRADLEALVRTAPDVSYDFDEATGDRHETAVRSPSEMGEDWAPAADTMAALNHLRRQASCASSGEAGHGDVTAEESNSLLTKLAANDALHNYGAPTSVLGKAWAGLVVRVMSARNHDFGNAAANSFYRPQMKNLAAAEHAVHALLAFDGKRSVYPKIAHTAMFSKTEDIVRNIQEIATVLEQSRKD